MAFPGAKVGYPGTIAALDPITASNNNKLPGGRLLYATGNSAQTNITTSTDITGCGGTCTVGTSRVIKITGKICQLEHEGATGTSKLVLNIDSVQEAVLFRMVMEDFDETLSTAVSASAATFEGTYVTTVTGGSHSFQLAVVTTAGHSDIAATGDGPENFILVEDIGPV